MNHLLTGFALLFCASVMNAQTQMPDVELSTLDGTTLNAQDLARSQGPTIVAFWATWCSPCKLELDAYNRLYAEWQDKYQAELVAVSIDGARQQKRVGPMAEQKGWGFTVLSDAPGALPAALAFQSIPQVYILDTDGRIVYSHDGYTPGDEAIVEAKLAELTGG